MFAGIVSQRTFLPKRYSSCLYWFSHRLGINSVSGKLDVWTDQTDNAKHITAPDSASRIDLTGALPNGQVTPYWNSTSNDQKLDFASTYTVGDFTLGLAINCDISMNGGTSNGFLLGRQTVYNGCVRLNSVQGDGEAFLTLVPNSIFSGSNGSWKVFVLVRSGSTATLYDSTNTMVGTVVTGAATISIRRIGPVNSDSSTRMKAQIADNALYSFAADSDQRLDIIKGLQLRTEL